MEKKETEKEELTLQNVPKAVNYLINEIAEMRAVLEHIESQLGLGVDKHRPIDIERAAEILGQTKNVIKKMVRGRELPYYDKGRKIYFLKMSLLNGSSSQELRHLQRSLVGIKDNTKYKSIWK